MNSDQHFVVDESVLCRIIELSNLKTEDIILEIGPGYGNLTKKLVNKVKKVYAIEKDKKLYEFLLKSKFDNLKLISGNALKITFPDFNKIVSNIPYSISEPLIKKLIYYNFELGVLLLPKKFSDILAGIKYTKLSLISESFFKIKQKDIVYPESFSPRPKTLSQITLIIPKKSNSKEMIFREFIKQKDKKVKNALREALIKINRVTKKESKKLIENITIDKKVSNLNLNELLKIKDFIFNL
ncbi:MAG: 16S rRNA (adenine(1518)-N(6)/adenine(1519)-N(6))-dimethyltransferase [Candidatus Aenigmarchaeota archaeon ex4484_56]|nr:MAG: 16S rRNA (adenine(1518)-N(6)/adenine(1519)-N(6))-dimethyltransferase [Candidatus Aenigmarchaeota archaeon ex4484_56]